MMTPSWTSMQMQLMESPWRDISTREPAMPLRPGAGTSLHRTAHFKLHLSKINQMLRHSFSAVVCESFSVFLAAATMIFMMFSCFLGSRRWFSIQKNQLVYQKKFKVRSE